jgi:hypothetical protein
MKIGCEVCAGSGCKSCDYKGYLDEEDIEKVLLEKELSSRKTFMRPE